MKSVFFGLVLFAASASFACEESCTALVAQLAGDYKCTIPGFMNESDAVEASIAKKSDSEMELEMNGETVKFVTDGTAHKSNYDDSDYTVKCADSALNITQTFKGQSAHVVIKKTEKGMDYSVVERGMTINCAKK
jgi:hypothetical protein